MSVAGIELGPAEIAKDRGVSIRTARRWLLALEKQHGAAVVGRRGRKVFTTRAALEEVAPRAFGDRKHLTELEIRVTDSESRIDVLATQLRNAERENAAFRRQALQWFKELRNKK